MWSRVEMCVVFCNFKKEACRVEMEPVFFFFFPKKKTLPFNGRKGQVDSHTSHLLPVMWALMSFTTDTVLMWFAITLLA